MIKIFGQTDNNFTSNGDIVVIPLKAKIYKADNSDFYLAIETDLSYIDYFLEGNIIIANTPQGDQAFRISNVQKTKNKISSKCYHVFYDSKNYLIADSYVQNKTCAEALAWLNNATEPVSEYTTGSDVETVASFRCVRKSLFEAIETILERWGGHLIRNNFDIQIKESIGVDNGVIIQYKKNLKDITCSENWDDVVTKILPVGKDGILLNALDPTASIYITSSVQYAIPYTKTVSFSQDINEEDYPDEQSYKQALISDLNAQAVKYLADNSLPKVNYTLKANIEVLTDIGDIIEVIDERLGVSLMTSVIAYEYDCLLEKYTEVEFGNFKNTISGLGNKISGLDNTVIQQGEKITSQGNEITGLNETVGEQGEAINDLDETVGEQGTDLENLGKAVTVLQNVMTANLTADQTYSGAGSIAQITLSSAVSNGSLLTFNTGAIVIGQDLTKVKISAHVICSADTNDGLREVYICKNNNSTILAQAQMSIKAGDTASIDLSSALYVVAPADVIFLMFKSAEADSIKEGSYLTIQAV